MTVGRPRRIGFRVLAGVGALLTGLLTIGSLETLLSPDSSDGVRMATVPHLPWLALGWCAAFATMLVGGGRVPAAMQQALAMLATLYLGALLPPRESDPVFYLGFGVVVGLLLVLHPARRFVLRPGEAGVSPVLMSLALIGSGPLVLYATRVLELMEGATPDDPFYTGIAATAVAAPGLGLAASLRAPGFRLPGWTAGVMVASLGGASLLFGGSGSLSAAWSIVAIAGAGAFVGFVEREARTVTRRRAGRDQPPRDAGRDGREPAGVQRST